MLREVGVGPTPGPRQASAVPPVPFQEHSTQATANHAAVIPEDAPVAVTEVVEPTLRRAIEPLKEGLQRFARFARGEVADAVDELPVALGSRKRPTSCS